MILFVLIVMFHLIKYPIRWTGIEPKLFGSGDFCLIILSLSLVHIYHSLSNVFKKSDLIKF